MTNSELIRACAEKVMGAMPERTLLPQLGGWTDNYQIPGVRTPLRIHSEDSPHIDKLEGWNPLASDVDAFMLVDRIREIIPKQTTTQTYSFRLCRTGIPGDWMCSFTVNEFDFSHQALADGIPDRRRAIVLAALKAVGIEL